MKSLFPFLLLLGVFLAFVPPANAQDSVADLIANHPDAGTLYTAIETAGLTAELREGSQLTLLVPTDAAFAQLPEGVVVALLKPENSAALRKLLEYHLLVGEADAVNPLLAKKLKIAQLSSGQELRVKNGAVYLIDQVLLPPDLDLKALIEER